MLPECIFVSTFNLSIFNKDSIQFEAVPPAMGVLLSGSLIFEYKIVGGVLLHNIVGVLCFI